MVKLYHSFMSAGDGALVAIMVVSAIVISFLAGMLFNGYLARRKIRQLMEDEIPMRRLEDADAAVADIIKSRNELLSAYTEAYRRLKENGLEGDYDGPIVRYAHLEGIGFPVGGMGELLSCCSNCGGGCAETDAYCRTCGAKLMHDDGRRYDGASEKEARHGKHGKEVGERAELPALHEDEARGVQGRDQGAEKVL